MNKGYNIQLAIVKGKQKIKIFGMKERLGLHNEEK